MQDLVPRGVAAAAVERLRGAQIASGLSSDDELMRAVAAVAAIVVPAALRSYASTLPVDLNAKERAAWVAERHPMGRLAVDATMPALLAIYGDLQAAAMSVALGYEAAQMAEEAADRRSAAVDEARGG